MDLTPKRNADLGQIISSLVTWTALLRPRMNICWKKAEEKEEEEEEGKGEKEQETFKIQKNYIEIKNTHARTQAAKGDGSKCGSATMDEPSSRGAERAASRFTSPGPRPLIHGPFAVSPR